MGEKILAEKRDFAQLEDFNRETSDEEYQKQYFENLQKPNRQQGKNPSGGEIKVVRLPDAEIEEINKKWVDNERTGMMWQIIKGQESQEFGRVISENPELAHIRSKDGRGPMFWAHEYGRKQMIKVLRQLGVSEERMDVNGVKPTDISHPSVKG